MRVERLERVGVEQLRQILALVATAHRVDGVAPLSEQVLLAARSGPAATAASPSFSPRDFLPQNPAPPHFLAYDGTHLAGYAHLEADPDAKAATAELVVDPDWRRQGVGTALILALKNAAAPGAQPLRLWSHGDLEGARALAVRDGYTILRELWQMRRSLTADAETAEAETAEAKTAAAKTAEAGTAEAETAEADPLPAAHLPAGLRTRRFVVGHDEDAWLRLNARAFVDHPEQGRMTRHDLDLRMAEPWFDANGLILVEDLRGPSPVLAASHWTKVVPPGPAATPTQGEVYVVGVDPAYQRLGLGRAVTLLGIEHLRERGLAEAMLYVDADNLAAVATYSRLGFHRSSVDIMYLSTVHPPL